MSAIVARGSIDRGQRSYCEPLTNCEPRQPVRMLAKVGGNAGTSRKTQSGEAADGEECNLGYDLPGIIDLLRLGHRARGSRSYLHRGELRTFRRGH